MLGRKLSDPNKRARGAITVIKLARQYYPADCLASVCMIKIDAGKDAPKVVNALIEIPKGSGIKYEYDAKREIIKVDRILHTSMVYPYNYGFIPGTLGEDGDPIDILVITGSSFYPGTLVSVRPIGALLMKDEEGIDTKLVAVPIEKVDPDMKGVNDVKDLNEHAKKMIGHFFSYYKSIEPGKWAEVGGWVGADEAYKSISSAIERARK